MIEKLIDLINHCCDHGLGDRALEFATKAVDLRTLELNCPAPAAGQIPAPPPAPFFRVTLEHFDADKKIQVIKAIREITGASLKDAKEMTEALSPTVLRTQLEYSAVEAAGMLRAAGATVLVVRE